MIPQIILETPIDVEEFHLFHKWAHSSFYLFTIIKKLSDQLITASDKKKLVGPLAFTFINIYRA